MLELNRLYNLDCMQGCLLYTSRFPRVDLPEVTERDGADESEVADNA